MSRHSIWTVFLAACLPHYTAQPLPPQPTPDQRVALYESLRATRDFGGGGQRSILLANREEIYYPEDLLPMVPPTSDTARHARRAEYTRTRAFWYAVLGGASLPITVPLAVVSFVAEYPPGEFMGTALAIGSLVMLGASVYYRSRSYEEIDAAFDRYNDDLARNLRVCAVGLQIVPCGPDPGLTAPVR